MTHDAATDPLTAKKREYESLLRELDAITHRITEIGNTLECWEDRLERFPTERQRRRFLDRIAQRERALSEEFERLKARGREISIKVSELARELTQKDGGVPGAHPPK